MVELYGHVSASKRTRWRGQRGIHVFYVAPETLPPPEQSGLPDWLVALGPIRVRVNTNGLTDMTGRPAPGTHVKVVGDLSVNEVYRGQRLPPHVDAVRVTCS